jgi:hypothetical protein
LGAWRLEAVMMDERTVPHSPKPLPGSGMNQGRVGKQCEEESEQEAFEYFYVSDLSFSLSLYVLYSEFT